MSAIKEEASVRRVNFDAWVEIVDIPSIKNLSQRRIRSMWYTKRGLYEIKKHNLETIAMMTLGKALYPELEYCGRGLCTENQIPERIEGVEKSLRVVLREQELQSKLGLPNDELLAEVYFDSSRESRLEARQLGLQDMKSLQIPPPQSSRSEEARRRVDLRVNNARQSVVLRENQLESKSGLSPVPRRLVSC
jgi:hypothetical protein